jgi:hypothetical protein
VSETRHTDPRTGGSKNRKLAELGTIDPLALWKLAEVGGYGATKYERYNYLRGFPWSWSFDALCRHLLAFWGGQDEDPESGLPHMAHVAWHALALLSFSLRGLGDDDRPPEGQELFDKRRRPVGF